MQQDYLPVNGDMAYIEYINYNDVRNEGMFFGMMIADQLDKKNEIDRLWKWAKTYMQFQSSQRGNYFAWHCKTNGIPG
jgi:oligosaccharide reducing-end xylanase